MFRGSSVTKIDAKGRLKLPSDFRRVLEETWGRDVFVTSVRGEVAQLFPLPVWESIESRLLALPTTDRTRQRFLQRVNYFGQQGRIDAQGRLVVNPILREAAGVTGEVVVCGNLDHLQIWNRERFLSRLEEEPFSDEDYGDLSLKGV
ncbi:MAG TPA: division/cell wall cluster transcriptional repressor MraZ [Thermoanaerobaculia bacterium]|nr:division/cell wall cluster transcriptional repressor MraZ [Thermoanaerobaculia bacterium]